MSREVNISYRFADDGPETDIEVRAPYFLLGTQRTSMAFWSLPRLREVGITQLTELGVADPVYFVGWDMLADLRREIGLLQDHLPEIDFDPDLKVWFLAHLVYAIRCWCSPRHQSLPLCSPSDRPDAAIDKAERHAISPDASTDGRTT